MSIPRGQVSLQQVRQDLDLSAAGSIRDRAVLNRVNKSGSDEISLSDHSGIACGQQLELTGIHNGPVNNRAYGYRGFYPNPSASLDYPKFEGRTVVCRANLTGGTSQPADGSCEYRVPFYVSEDGNYRATVDYEWNNDPYYSLTSWQWAVVTSSIGYLNGVTTTAMIQAGGNYTSESGTLDRTFSLRTARPYAVIILYAIRKSGGDASKPPSYFKCTNLKVEKV